MLSALRTSAFPIALQKQNVLVDCARAFSSQRLLVLNDLQHIPGSFRRRRRVGRGPGSGRGKLCGYGHQKSRSTPRAFEGGQTPLYKRLPKIGFHNPNKRDIRIVTLQKIQEFMDTGRLTAKANAMLTLKDLMTCGLISNCGEGVKIVATGMETFRSPIHLEVTSASQQAIEVIEKNGGTVTCVHFNRLALRALLQPHKFDILPWRARPPPKIMQFYLDKDKAGYMSPEIQIRNLKIFGSITSEHRLREEHAAFMAYKQYLVSQGKRYEDWKKQRLFVQ